MTKAARIAMAGLVALLVLVASPGVAHADTVRGLQWYLGSLRIASAQARSEGDGVIVGLVDSGVDATHPDLAGQVLPGYGIGGDAAPDGRTDAESHGTGMASIIAAKGGGENHELGIAPKARILPIATGIKQDAAETAQGIRWAVDHGAKVINLSVAGTGAVSDADQTAVQYALDHDVVVVAGAGNTDNGSSAVGSPARIPGVIAVSGTTRAGGFWPGSAHGPEVVLAAPAERIIAAAPAAASPNGYLVTDGTSDATAIVSGVVALVRARYPALNAANVINRLIRTAQDLGPAGRDPQFGFGLVDPVAALTASVPEVTANPLLAGGASAQPTDTRAPVGTGPAVQVSVNWPVLLGCLAVVVLVVVLVIVLIVRAARRRPTPPPPGYRPPGPPGR